MRGYMDAQEVNVVSFKMASQNEFVHMHGLVVTVLMHCPCQSRSALTETLCRQTA